MSARPRSSRAGGDVAYKITDGNLEITPGSRSVTIQLPRSMAGTTPDIKVVSQTGSIDLRGGDYGKVDLEANTGSIDARGGSAESVTVRNGTGSIDLRGRYGNVDARGELGSLDINTTDAKTITVTSGTGSVDVNAEGGQPESVTVNANTGSTDIRVPRGGLSGADPGRSRGQPGDHRAPSPPNKITTTTGTGSVEISYS